MRQRKKEVFRELAEQWWDEQESMLDASSDLVFNEIDLEDTDNDEEESFVDESV